MTKKSIRCPKCNENMINKGNISGIAYNSFCPYHYDVWVCEDCKMKKTVRVDDFVIETEPKYANFTEVGCDD